MREAIASFAPLDHSLGGEEAPHASGYVFM